MQGSNPRSGAHRRKVPVDGAAGLSLHFARGARPDTQAIAAGAQGFGVSHWPGDDGDPAELLMLGLTFAAFGLAPGPAARGVPLRHGYEVLLPQLAGAEAVRIVPAGSAPVAVARPTLRALVALGCALAELPGLMALGWQAAGTAMSPGYYRRIMQAWLDGGAFPGLGLAALVRDSAAMRSEGLALFIGHEIAVTLEAGGSPAGAAKLAIRAMHGLVEEGCGPDMLPRYLGVPGLPGAFSADGGLYTIG